MQLAVYFFRMYFPCVGEMPEVRLVIDDSDVRPIFCNVLVVAVVLVQNNIQHELITYFFADSFPLIRIFIFLFNGFQCSGRGVFFLCMI